MSIPMPKLGWMAGIVDMKGKFIVKNNQDRVTPQVVLMVESKTIGIIRELGSLTGTKPEIQAAKPLRDFMRRGCSEHCPEAHVHVDDKDLVMPRTARWTITGAAMVVVLDNLLPFLVVDQDYENVIRQVMENTTVVGQGSGAVRASLIRLRDLGWDLPPRYAKAVRPLSEALQDNGGKPAE